MCFNSDVDGASEKLALLRCAQTPSMYEAVGGGPNRIQMILCTALRTEGASKRDPTRTFVFCPIIMRVGEGRGGPTKAGPALPSTASFTPFPPMDINGWIAHSCRSPGGGRLFYTYKCVGLVYRACVYMYLGIYVCISAIFTITSK